jgi:hypothetical protein
MSDPSDLHLILSIPLLPALFFLWGWMEWTRSSSTPNRHDLDHLLVKKYSGGFAQFARRVREHRRRSSPRTPTSMNQLDRLMIAKQTLQAELKQKEGT